MISPFLPYSSRGEGIHTRWASQKNGYKANIFEGQPYAKQVGKFMVIWYNEEQ